MVNTNSTLKDRYVLKQELGRDQIGTTFSALDLRQQEVGIKPDHVAIKVLNQEVVEHTGLLFSLQEEVSTTRTLQCENVVTIHDYDQDDDLRFVVMELLDGETLDVHLSKQAKRLARPVALQIIEGICRGLEVAHQREVVHGGICPKNILYTTDKIAKLYNFGVDDLFDDSQEPDLYASPEKLSTGMPKAADDVFSVAVIAYQLLTGRHPFNGVPATLDSKPPNRILTMMPGRWRVLSGALSLTRENRANSISEFRKGLFS